VAVRGIDGGACLTVESFYEICCQSNVEEEFRKKKAIKLME
jgi:hypothetical protein